MPITRAQANSRLRTATAVNLAAFRFNSQLNESRRVSRTLVDVSSAIPSGSADPQSKAPSETVDTAADAEVKAELFAVELQTGAAMAATSLTEKSSVKGAAVVRAKKSTKAAALPSVAPDRLPDLRKKAARIAQQLQQLYPDPPIPLDHSSHFQLLCAVLLSAQTTDKKVNEVTPRLFQLAPDAAAMAAADLATITDCIKQLGLAPTKAKNLKAMSQMLVSLHSGEVPATFAELEALPGVGHKTASVVMAQAFGHSAFPVDTHIHRLAQRWGLTAGRSVEQTEADLKLLFPEPLWRDLHLQIIFFGRGECPALRHHPSECPICCWAAVQPYDKVGVSPLKPGQRASSSSGDGSNSGPSPARRKRKLPLSLDDARNEGAPQRGASPEQADVAPAGTTGAGSSRASRARRGRSDT